MSRAGEMDQSVDSALKLIDTVTSTADIVCVNKNQCQRLAQRFDAIRKALPTAHYSSNGGSVDSGSEAPSAMEKILPLLLKVLGDGEVLVRSYADERDALRNVLYRAENVDAFKEVHGEIDTLATYLDFKDPSSPSEKSNRLLSSDADTDRGQMLPQLHSLNLRVLEEDHTGSSLSRDDVLENMNDAITDKCYKADSNAEDLSYLNIPFSAIRLEGAIKELKPLHERKSQGDAHLDGMAIVQKGSWNGVDCAIKVFKSEKSHWNQAELRKEIASLVKLRHPHITQFIGCSQDQEKTYVLYEKMDGDLRVCMENRRKKKHRLSKLWRGDDRPFSRTEEMSIITQIARGVFYLHEKGYVHGELKCTNLLVKEMGDHIDVKVADFHCSRQLGAQEPNTKLYSPAHRPRWMPPEAFDHYNVEQPEDELLKQGDVYSFAMTCYEVATGKYPFDGVKENLEAKIKAGERPKLPDDLSADLKNLITKCWDPNPEQRPSFQDICYVLKVDAVNLMSQVQKLLANFCLGVSSSCNEPAIADEASETDTPSWTEVLKLDESEPAAVDQSSEETIDTAAKDLPHYLKIRPFDLKPGRYLGKGASAEVYEANWIGCKFAVKWLKVAQAAKLRDEMGIMIRLLHPNVIRLVGFSVFKNRCAIVMELMENSLKEFIKARIEKANSRHAVPFSEPDALSIIAKLALGMAFLHSRDVAHGDLKCENVLVRNAGNKLSRLDVKIVDFGLSHLLQLAPRAPGKLRPSRVVGRSRAPEVILRHESKNDEQVDFDPKAADVYSFASTCFEIITGKTLFYDVSDSAAEAIIRLGGKPKLPSHVSVRPDLRQLLDDCWAYPEIAKRPKFSDIVDRLARMSKC